MWHDDVTNMYANFIFEKRVSIESRRYHTIPIHIIIVSVLPLQVLRYLVINQDHNEVSLFALRQLNDMHIFHKPALRIAA